MNHAPFYNEASPNEASPTRSNRHHTNPLFRGSAVEQQPFPYSLCSFNDGVLALNGFLAILDSTESNLQATFGEDVGMAFLILGQLKLCHHQLEEAATCFRAALRHNPFLWSAFSGLCELGEEVSPDECFKVSEYPEFLRPHPLVGGGMAPPTASSSSQPFVGARVRTRGGEVCPSDQYHTPSNRPDDKICADSAIFAAGGGMGGGSVFKPVIGQKKAVFVTPCAFHEPIGGAIASSTPARRDFAHPPAAMAAPPLTVGDGRGKGWESVRLVLDWKLADSSVGKWSGQLVGTPVTQGARLNPR